MKLTNARMQTIKDNILRIEEQIQIAALSVGRQPEDVRLVVVTKGQPIEVVNDAIEAGAKFLGENYPEETLTKIQGGASVAEVEWHMIGHLQSRKSKIVTEHFSALQSLDSLSLAEKMNRLLVEAGKVLPVMMQFNVSGEESKYGWDATDVASWDQYLPVVKAIHRLPALRLIGLMTMPPLFAQPELVRPYFERLRLLRDFFNDQIPGLSLTELSMGTSSDFPFAVQEGSTYIRVGTAIVGPRSYKN